VRSYLGSMKIPPVGDEFGYPCRSRAERREIQRITWLSDGSDALRRQLERRAESAARRAVQLHEMRKREHEDLKHVGPDAWRAREIAKHPLLSSIWSMTSIALLGLNYLFGQRVA
jgi:hypothetical protein